MILFSVWSSLPVQTEGVHITKQLSLLLQNVCVTHRFNANYLVGAIKLNVVGMQNVDVAIIHVTTLKIKQK